MEKEQKSGGGGREEGRGAGSRNHSSADLYKIIIKFNIGFIPSMHSVQYLFVREDSSSTS